MFSRSISCYTSWLSPPPPSWVSWSRSCIWSELEVAETIRVDVAEVVASEEKLEVAQLVEDHTHTQKIKWIGRAILMNDELRIARLKIALQRPFLGRAILIFTKNIVGPVAGANAAAGRRSYALNLERRMANQRRADQLSRMQGKSLLRRGQFKIDWFTRTLKQKHS